MSAMYRGKNWKKINEGKGTKKQQKEFFDAYRRIKDEQQRENKVPQNESMDRVPREIDP